MLTTRRAFLAAAAPAIVTGVEGRRGHSRREIDRLASRDELKGKLTRDDLPTPALVLDLDAFEWNVAKMAGHLKARGRAFRPHGKTHKCPEIARRLVAAGAVGNCAAKLSEAEVFADHGIVGGLLVTTAVVGRRKIARAVELAAKRPDTIFSVDDAQNVRDLNEAAEAFNRGPQGRRSRPPKPARVTLAVDLLIGRRTGIAPGQPALELARLVDSLPHVRLAGLQAYDGSASHTVGFEQRKKVSQDSMSQAVETRRLFERSGLECPLVSGGSTGTYNIDAEIDGVTELQPGSFMFMDVDYNRIGGADGPAYHDFKNALSVLTTVVSKRPGVAIVDGGYKAFSTDRPFTPVAKRIEGLTYGWAGDEHGRLDLTNASADVRLGDRIEFIIPHCDPSVNLYDRLYCLRGDLVEAIWPIAARGMSQ